MNNTSAIISVLEFENNNNEHNHILFNPITEVSTFRKDQQKCINLCILTSILTDDSAKTFTVNLIYLNKSLDNSNTIQVHPKILKEFSLDDTVKKDGQKIPCLISKFCKHRSDVCINITNVPVSSDGTHIVVLNELSQQEIAVNPTDILNKCIAFYPFNVVTKDF